MKASLPNNNSRQKGGKLRNFDLSVEEIRIIKAIEDLTRALENTERNDTQPADLEYFRTEISKLEEKLDEIRENTLIK